MNIKIPRIELSAKLKGQLAAKYGVTTQAIRNALKYHTNSDQAQKIRKDAIKLLKKEAKNASVNINQ